MKNVLSLAGKLLGFMLRLLFHLIWVLPLLRANYPWTAAGVIAVAIPYIKTKKLEAYIQTLRLHAADPAVIAQEELVRRRWSALTFLPK